MLQQILSMGIPSGLQNSIISIANIVVQSNINAFGAMAVAGCGAYSRIEGFGFLPITSFALSMTTFIGQNLGAKKYDRARKGQHLWNLCHYDSGRAGWPVDLLAGSTADLRIQPCTGGHRIRNPAGKNRGFILFPACILSLYRRVSCVVRAESLIPYAGHAVMLVHHSYHIRIYYHPIMYPGIKVVFWAYPITWSLSSLCFPAVLSESGLASLLRQNQRIINGKDSRILPIFITHYGVISSLTHLLLSLIP